MAGALGLTPNRIVVLIAVTLLGYFAVIGVSNAVHNASLAREQRQLERELNSLVVELDQLQAIKEYVRTDEYIESVARNELGMVRRGEVLVRVIPSEPGEDEAPAGRPSPWWERLFGR